MKDWIRRNKLASILLLILLVVLLKQWGKGYASRMSYEQPGVTNSYMPTDVSLERGALQMGKVATGGMMPPSDIYAPAPEVSNRMVIQNSDLSLLVKDVRQSIDAIIISVRQMGGYMVNSSLSSPGESPSGSITVRVPSRDLQKTLELLRGMAIRVVSENLTGQDVTDQFVDNEARLATLERTKIKFEDIFNRATEISDIVNIQQQILNVQSQIDGVKGQQQYLQKNAEMVRVTIYLSTDELALPYAPQDAWRPAVIYKYAVRSLVGHFRAIAEWLIWIGVYSIIWVPALILLWYMKKRFRS